MLFCLSICDETQRVILDQDWHGEVLAMVEGRDWQEAREEAELHPALDAFTYRAGWEQLGAFLRVSGHSTYA